MKLQFNEVSGHIPQADHATDTLFRGGGDLHRNPLAILHKVELTADLCVAEIPGFQIGSFHPFQQLRDFHRALLGEKLLIRRGKF